jgi:hypothetical protein
MNAGRSIPMALKRLTQSLHFKTAAKQREQASHQQHSEGTKAVGRRSVFGYFEGYGPNMQYPNDAYRITIRPSKRALRPRISAPPAFLRG